MPERQGKGHDDKEEVKEEKKWKKAEVIIGLYIWSDYPMILISISIYLYL